MIRVLSMTRREGSSEERLLSEVWRVRSRCRPGEARGERCARDSRRRGTKQRRQATGNANHATRAARRRECCRKDAGESWSLGLKLRIGVGRQGAGRCRRGTRAESTRRQRGYAAQMPASACCCWSCFTSDHVRAWWLSPCALRGAVPRANASGGFAAKEFVLLKN